MKPQIREIRPQEYEPLGALMVGIYACLDDFPSPEEQPDYYEMLSGIGSLNEREHMQVLVAISPTGELAGGIVYLDDMAAYGVDGATAAVKDASGIRLLGVDPKYRGQGIGKALTLACIDRARAGGRSQVVLHTTEAMNAAWSLYRNLGFRRSPDLDFLQGGLQVFGFRLGIV